MDNVTHTLMGVVIGRGLAGKSADSGFKKATFWTAVIGSNLIDLDFVFGPWTRAGDNLTYLLHHRGWTHTLVGAVPIALLTAALGAWIGRVKFKDRGLFLFGMALLAILAHIFADYWNNYGVHPFAPMVNRWFYGDFIFIVEPALWLAMVPFAVAESERNWARALWAAIGAGIVLASWSMRQIPTGVAFGLTVWGVVMIFAQWSAKRAQWKLIPSIGVAIAVAIAGAALVLGVFGLGSNLAARKALAIHRAEIPGETVIDYSLVPAPGNPICWKFVMAASDSKGDYVAREGIVSLAPRLYKPAQCVFSPENHRLAEFSPANPSTVINVAWEGELHYPVSELRAMVAKDCRFAAFLAFARIPFWVKRGDRQVAGDLRYDFRGEASFAAVKVGEGLPCPANVPSWKTPISIRFGL